MFSPQRIAKATTVALVAGGIAVPAASAMPIGGFAPQAPPTHISTQINPTQAARHFRAVHRPDPSVPVAVTPTVKPFVYSPQDKQLVPNSPTQAPVTTTPVVHVSTPGSSFDWGDAAIGAGASGRGARSRPGSASGRGARSRPGRMAPPLTGGGARASGRGARSRPGRMAPPLTGG
jgi:hypothetical protein